MIGEHFQVRYFFILFMELENNVHGTFILFVYMVYIILAACALCMIVIWNDVHASLCACLIVHLWMLCSCVYVGADILGNLFHICYTMVIFFSCIQNKYFQ